MATMNNPIVYDTTLWVREGLVVAVLFTLPYQFLPDRHGKGILVAVTNTHTSGKYGKNLNRLNLDLVCLLFTKHE